MDVCDHDFHLVAQRKCVTLSDGQTYCPSAYGKRTPRLEDLKVFTHDSPTLAVEHHEHAFLH